MGSQVVVFALGQEEYAMPIEVVREITRLMDVRSIPQAPDYVEGLINIRGNAIPVIDLCKRFDISSLKEDLLNKKDAFALITEVEGSLVAFKVDEVREVRVLDNLVPPPPLVTASFIGGIVNLPDRIIMQLKPERILENYELMELNSIAS